jgi:FKBP-type peptidyl-prolyl cis-trans isomerase
MKLIYFALLVFVLGTYYQDLIKTKSGLQYMILKKGKGNKARAGDEILLFETTRYRDGTVLYTNENSKNPVKVKIGANQATEAVDEALRGMKTGEIREIIAPSYLVKRKSYPPNVSPDSTLVIRLILHKILKAEKK